MEKLSILAFHPVKMQSCYQKVEELNLEGLQQRFNVHGTSVFVSRAQILMREVRCHAGVLLHNTEKECESQSAAWFVLGNTLTPAGKNKYYNQSRLSCEQKHSDV